MIAIPHDSVSTVWKKWLYDYFKKQLQRKTTFVLFVLYTLVRLCVLINLSCSWLLKLSIIFSKLHGPAILASRALVLNRFHAAVFLVFASDAFYIKQNPQILLSMRTPKKSRSFFLYKMHEKQKDRKQRYEMFSILVGSVPIWRRTWNFEKLLIFEEFHLRV